MRLDGDGIERTTTAIHYFNCLKIKYSQKSFPGDVITASGSITIDGINAEDGVDPFTDIPTLKRPHEQARRIPATFRKGGRRIGIFEL